MIYCAVPEPLADELYEKLVSYYDDDPNVEVIVDRRKSSRREQGTGGGGQRETRDPRRPRVNGGFPPPPAGTPAPAPARPCPGPSRRSPRRSLRAVKVVVHVDGGARGNPGPAAAAAVISSPDGDVLDEASEFLGVATNNVAEYRGLLLGLARAKALGADEIEVVNDSELVAKQVTGEYRVKHPD